MASGAQIEQNDLRGPEILRQPLAAETTARLRGQVESLQQQVTGLRQSLVAAERPSDDGEINGLVEANATLVLSVIHAEAGAESSCASGRRTVKTVPASSDDRTVTEPPWPTTISRTMKSPSPKLVLDCSCKSAPGS